MKGMTIMKQKLFNSKNYVAKCGTCKFSRTTEDGAVLCDKKGAVAFDDSCRKYQYDPLRRNPEKPMIHADFSPEDFQL